MCASSFQPLPLKKLICSVSFVLFCILYFTRTQPQLNLGCWVTERRTVKGRERETKDEGERTRQVVGTAAASARGAFSAGTQLLSCHRGPAFHQNIPPLFAPLLKHKRGEQAWAGIIGSFLSASAMCKDSNNGRIGRGNDSKWDFHLLPSAKALLLSEHANVCPFPKWYCKAVTHRPWQKSTASFIPLCDGQFRLLCSSTSISTNNTH